MPLISSVIVEGSHLPCKRHRRPRTASPKRERACGRCKSCCGRHRCLGDYALELVPSLASSTLRLFLLTLSSRLLSWTSRWTWYSIPRSLSSSLRSCSPFRRTDWLAMFLLICN